MDGRTGGHRISAGRRSGSGHRRRVRLGVAATFALAGCLAGCRQDDLPADFDERARTFVERWGEAARAEWLRSPSQWSLGLDDEVAGDAPERSARAVTIRDLATGGLAGASCRPGGSAGDSKIVYRTVVEIAGRPVAAFVWGDLRSAIDGHRQVRRILAASRADPAQFRRALETHPALEAARVFRAPERGPCPAAAVPPPRAGSGPARLGDRPRRPEVSAVHHELFARHEVARR